MAKDCIEIKVCVTDEVSNFIERYQAYLKLSKGQRLRKPEVAEMLLEITMKNEAQIIKSQS